MDFILDNKKIKLIISLVEKQNSPSIANGWNLKADMTESNKLLSGTMEDGRWCSVADDTENCIILYWIIWYGVIYCNLVLYSIVWYCDGLRCAVLYSTAL